MNLVINVIIGLAVLIILYYIFTYFFKKSTTLTKMTAANITQKISASSLPNNSNTSNYTYSLWFYIDDWNYRYGEEKQVLIRQDGNNDLFPAITLGNRENDLIVYVSCYPENDNTGVVDNNSITHSCKIKNVPLQSWVNIMISLYGRTLDLYMDGKLVRTCMLPGVAKVNPKSDIVVTPGGGFSGYTANIEYWPDSSNPQQAYNVYKAGMGGSILGNLFNKYRVKISLLDGNKEQTSFEI